MKKYLALILSVCIIFSTFAVMTVSAATENRNIAPESTVEKATDGYADNDVANLFDGDFNTYYMAGKVTDADGTVLNNSSSNVVWIKLADNERVTRIEATFGKKADRTTLFGNSGNQNKNFYMYLTDFGPDEGAFNDNEGIVTPEGKTSFRVTNGYGDQSKYESMKLNISETTKFTYLAIWGPYSAGLCLSELKIFADAEKKEIVIPPGTTTKIVEKQITPDSADFVGNYITSAANIAANIIDGDESTMAISDGFARHMYIDLGQEYNITKIEVTYPTEADITAFVKNNDIDTDAASAMNISSQVYVSAETPTTNVMPETRVNPSTNVGKGSKATYAYKVESGKETTAVKDLGNFRYISFTQGTGSNPTAVAEVKVYALVEEIVSGDLVQVNKNVAKSSYGAVPEFLSWGNTPNYVYSNLGYEAENVLDGDSDTIGFGALPYNDGNNHYSGNLLLIDLGEVREVTKVKLAFPTSAQIAKAKEDVGSKLTSNMNQSAVVFLTNNRPTSSVLDGTNYTGEGVTLYSGNGFTSQSLITNSDKNSYRYLGIYVPYSCGLALADVEVFANIWEEAAPAQHINIAKNKMVYSNANNATLSGYSERLTYELNAVDGKADTIFAGTTYAINDSDKELNFETVVDLGAEYQVSDIKFIPYGNEKSSIYGSNSSKFDDLEAIATNIDTIDNVALEYKGINKSYRYIMVDRIGSEVNQLLGIRDIEVYSELQEADVLAATQNKAGVKVSLNKEVFNTGSIRFGGMKENMNDGVYDHGDGALETFVISATSGQSHYAVMDLGRAHKITGVGLTQALGCSGFNESGAVIVATNEEITESTDLSKVAWTELAKGFSYGNSDSKYVLPIEITDATAYRYIGIKGASGMGVPMREVDVYTSAEDFDLGTYSVVRSGRDVNVNFTSSYADGIDSVKVLVANYDVDGVLIDLVNETLDITWNGSGSGSKTLTDAISADATATKVFIIDSLLTLSPLTNCTTF